MVNTWVDYPKRQPPYKDLQPIHRKCHETTIGNPWQPFKSSHYWISSFDVLQVPVTTEKCTRSAASSHCLTWQFWHISPNRMMKLGASSKMWTLWLSCRDLSTVRASLSHCSLIPWLKTNLCQQIRTREPAAYTRFGDKRVLVSERQQKVMCRSWYERYTARYPRLLPGFNDLKACIFHPPLDHRQIFIVDRSIRILLLSTQAANYTAMWESNIQVAEYPPMKNTARSWTFRPDIGVKNNPWSFCGNFGRCELWQPKSCPNIKWNLPSLDRIHSPKYT